MIELRILTVLVGHLSYGRIPTRPQITKKCGPREFRVFTMSIEKDLQQVMVCTIAFGHDPCYIPITLNYTKSSRPSCLPMLAWNVPARAWTVATAMKFVNFANKLEPPLHPLDPPLGLRSHPHRHPHAIRLKILLPNPHLLQPPNRHLLPLDPGRQAIQQMLQVPIELPVWLWGYPLVETTLQRVSLH